MSATSKAFEAEPEELAAQVVTAAGDRPPPGFPVFVRYRFWRPFQYSVKSAGWYGWAFSGLSVLVIAAGLGVLGHRRGAG